MALLCRAGGCGEWQAATRLKQLGAAPSCALRTLAPALSAKTPIQEWGWEYLQRQRALKRPIAPHLSVYKPQLTWMVSGLHRISGVVMGGAVAVVSVALMAAPVDFAQIIEFLRQLGLPAVITASFKFVVAWPIIFHSLNGIRFLGFDLAKGTEIATVYKTGWTVVVLSVLLAIAVVLWPQPSSG